MLIGSQKAGLVSINNTDVSSKTIAKNNNEGEAAIAAPATPTPAAPEV